MPWIIGLLLLAGPTVFANEDAPAPMEPQTTSTQESEKKVSEPITPITVFPEKTPYEEARNELIKAFELWNAGDAEAASDKALEAYDDLVALRRVPGVKRAKIRADIYQAASLYVESAIKFIQQWLQDAGKTPETVQEARSRLEDLRDVARDYKDLEKRLISAIEKLSHSTPSAPPAQKSDK